MDRLEQILSQYWGFKSFRNYQKEIIETFLKKKDVLAVLPTGGGKTLCYQIPAMAEDGMCLVVSPLVSLMQDQVSALLSKGIKAMYLPGGTHASDIDRLLDNCIYGNYKFLYLSPERLLQDLVRERIKRMPLNFLAVDEAHCISQWGHDFRPAYRSIEKLRELRPELPMIAVTATATAEVVTDIAKQLRFKDPAIFRFSAARKNLIYDQQWIDHKDQKSLELLKAENGSAIIYQRTRKESQDTAQFLFKNGIAADFFHGGLTSPEKSKKILQWQKNQTRVMVATSAFGMGIDKADVRLVLHHYLPDSIENYVQEAGRAGRDGKPAKALLLVSPTDLYKHQRLMEEYSGALEQTKEVYKRLNAHFGIAYGEGSGASFSFQFADFCNKYKLPPKGAFQSIQFLEGSGVLDFEQKYKHKISVRLLYRPYQLTIRSIQNPGTRSVTEALSRSYPGILDVLISIQLKDLSTKTQLSEASVLEKLHQLEKEQVLELVEERADTLVTFLVPREDEATFNPLKPYLENRISVKKDKANQLIKYVKDQNHCREVLILSYLGENNPEPCGKCSFCLKVDYKS